MKIRILAPLLALGLTATAQAADNGRVADFRIAGVALQMDLPAGHCLPSGKFADIAQMMAATDNENVTLVTAFRCPKGELDADMPILVKTPKAAMTVTASRPELLEALGPTFDNPDFEKQLNSAEITRKAGESMSTVFGSKTETSMSIKPVGRDGTCGYLAGLITISDDKGSSTGSMAACMTTVKGKILTLYVYGPGTENPAALIPKVRTLAAALIARNER